MQQGHSVPEQQGKAIVDVKALRARNRAETQKRDAIDNVVDRLRVFGALSKDTEIHPKVVREHAERIVEAVLGLTKPAVQEVA